VPPQVIGCVGSFGDDGRGVDEWDFRVDTDMQLAGGWLAAPVMLDNGLPGVSRRGWARV
jgi:hypothetical protein